MSTTDYYRYEQSTVYPRCSNCRIEVTDSTYEHALGRLCKLCYQATRDHKTLEFRGKMLQRTKDKNDNNNN